MAFALYDKAANRRLFEITKEQLDALKEALEAESPQDHDYFIDASVCEFLAGKVDAGLLGRLHEVVGAPAIAAEPVPAAGELVGDGDGIEDDDVPEEAPPASALALGESGIEIEWREE